MGEYIFNKKLIGGIVVVILTLCLVFILYFPRSSSIFIEISHTAAIVDGRTPNQTFTQSLTSMLEEDANFTVRYIKDVTISFYEKLPTYGYGLIILRIHSAVRKDTDLVDFFTNEPYKKGKYNKPGISMATIFDNKTFFAIGPDFVEKTMNGVFENSVIIATGCNGTTYLTMGRALKDKGASVYIGWNGYVDPNYADAATEQLLKHLLLENQTVADSVSAIDSDPRWNSELEYYPHEIGDLKIRKKKQGITGLNSALISVLKMLGETLKTSEVCMGRRFNFEDCFLSPRIVY